MRNKEVEITFGLNNDEKVLKACKELNMKEFKPKGRYSYKTLEDHKMIRVLVEVDLFDSIIVISDDSQYKRVIYDLVHDSDLKKFELNNETLEKLFKTIKHKFHLIYVKKSLISNPNSPQLS